MFDAVMFYIGEDVTGRIRFRRREDGEAVAVLDGREIGSIEILESMR